MECVVTHTDYQTDACRVRRTKNMSHYVCVRGWGGLGLALRGATPCHHPPPLSNSLYNSPSSALTFQLQTNCLVSKRLLERLHIFPFIKMPLVSGE